MPPCTNFVYYGKTQLLATRRRRNSSFTPEVYYAIAITIILKNGLWTHFCDCDSYSPNRENRNRIINLKCEWTLSTLERSVVCRWTVRSDVVGGRAWDRFSVVLVDAPAVTGRLVALRRAVLPVRTTLRDKYPSFRINAIHLLRIPSFLCAV